MISLTTLLALPLLAVAPARPKHATVVDSTQMTLVVVENERTVPITVYAQDSWGEYKLGVVDAGATSTLRLPAYVADRGGIDIFVHPRRGFEEDTGYLEVNPGDHIGVVVPQR